MENKLETCAKCKSNITEDNFGDVLGKDELLYCEKCSKKKILDLITNLNNFRKSKDFKSILALRKKILWTSEYMGRWHDNADKSIMEGVKDYDSHNIFELQINILDSVIVGIDNYTGIKNLEVDFDEVERKYPDLLKLRAEAMEEIRRLSSYLFG